MARISLVSGGKTVNGQFVANAPTSSSSSGSQVSANQLAAAKLGVSIPGVNGAMLPSSQIAKSTITSDALKPTPGINLPQAPTTPNVGNMVTANNAGLANPAYNITSDPKGTLTVTPPTVPNTDTSSAGLDSIFKSYLNESQKIAPVNSADIYNAQYKADHIASKQQEVNNYAGQLNTIVANRDANILQTQGQGRGIPEVIIGGQQAQINKEAAIQALPVQAQLAAAQGNLALAQDHLDTMVRLKTQDAQNYYNYKNKLLDSVYNFATASETRRLDQLKAENDKKYQEKQAFIKAQASALSNALGQEAPSSVYNAIKSATDLNGVAIAAGKYNGDILAREAQKANIAQSYASIATSKLQQQKLLQELNPSKDITDAQNKDLVAYANQYADSGTLPSPSELKLAGLSAGQVTEYAKQVPRANGALVSRSTGTKQKSLSATQEDGVSALYDLTKKLDIAKERFSKLDTGLLAGIGKSVFQTQAQQQYDDLKGEIVDLLSRARSGAALTESEVKIYSDKLPGRFNSSLFFGNKGTTSIQDLKDSIEGKLDTHLNTNNLAIYGHSDVNVPSYGKATVGSILDIGGTKYRVLPDGSLTDVI